MDWDTNEPYDVPCGSDHCKDCKPCPKRRYRDEFEAKMALYMASKPRNPRRHESRIYYHKPCKAWHLTSMSERRG